jgi:hypothetical protein
VPWAISATRDFAWSGDPSHVQIVDAFLGGAHTSASANWSLIWYAPPLRHVIAPQLSREARPSESCIALRIHQSTKPTYTHEV